MVGCREISLGNCARFVEHQPWHHIIKNRFILTRNVSCPNRPKLFSSFMLQLLAELYAVSPEEGDLDKPKLIMFIDEAHLIFNEATDALLQHIETIIKLIRSKGIGIFFCTQNLRAGRAGPGDVSVLPAPRAPRGVVQVVRFEKQAALARRIALGAARAAGGKTRRRAAAPRARAAGGDFRRGHHRARARRRAVGGTCRRPGPLFARAQAAGAVARHKRMPPSGPLSLNLPLRAEVTRAMPMIACLWVPELSLVAALRAEPQLCADAARRGAGRGASWGPGARPRQDASGRGRRAGTDAGGSASALSVAWWRQASAERERAAARRRARRRSAVLAARRGGRAGTRLSRRGGPGVALRRRPRGGARAGIGRGAPRHPGRGRAFVGQGGGAAGGARGGGRV